MSRAAISPFAFLFLSVDFIYIYRLIYLGGIFLTYFLANRLSESSAQKRTNKGIFPDILNAACIGNRCYYFGTMLR